MLSGGEGNGRSRVLCCLALESGDCLSGTRSVAIKAWVVLLYFASQCSMSQNKKKSIKKKRSLDKT
jgi:hypothetical protein